MDKVQMVAIVGSLCYLGLIFPLVFKRRIHEEYAILWLFFGGVLLVFSLWRDGLEYLAALVGVHYPPVALLLILIGALLLILVQFSVVISRLSKRIIELTQEIGLVKYEIERLQKEKEKKK
ncbi:MAG: DUF2304 domain-containing protein [Brevinematales bacterium]|nr:DUF2304 domain-containing protein [Brevinematales bacterium]